MAGRQNQILQDGAPAPEIADLTPQRPVLLVFFKVTCPVCQLTLPYLNRIPNVVGISQDNAEDTDEFVREFGIRFPVLLDTEDAGYPASNAYGISSVPSLFLVEANGRIARVTEGWSKREMLLLGAISEADHVPEWKAG
jgi:peroxiredoxin